MGFLESIQTFLLIVIVVANTLLCFIVFKNNPNSTTNKIFALLGLTMSGWISVYYISYQPFSPDINLFLIRLSISIATLMSMLLFFLAHTLPSNKLKIKKKYLIVLLTITALVVIITLSPYAFIKVEIINNFPYPTPGPALALFVSFIIISIISVIYLLFSRFKSSKGIEKSQLLFIMLGTILMYGLMITTVLLPVALFKNITFVSLAPFYTLLFLIMTAYAIIKHRFLDIRLLVARTVSFTLLVIIFAIFYAVLFALLSSIFIASSMSSSTIAISTVLALFMVFTFQPVRRLLEKITDKAFYKDHYNTNDLLYNLTYIMASTLRLEDLTHQVLQELLKQMRVSRGVFILIQEGKIYEVAQEGYDKVPELDEEKIMSLMVQNNTLVFEEMPESDLKETMRNLDFSIIAHLVTEGNRIGLLALGPHLSGDIYTSEDIKVLEILAPGVAVAIENSKSYEEIRRFNITLEEEIDQATQSLKEANERLQQIDKLKDEFVSLASHELRTPMTVIKSYLWYLVEGKIGDLNEKQKLYLDRAYASTDRLINLVNDMLNVSRIESGRLTIESKSVDMKSLAEEVVSEMMPKTQEQGISLEVKEASCEIARVYADPDRIKQVLINLVGNSLKFTDRGGKITISFSQKDGQVATEISDNGQGIPKEEIPKLFQKFETVGNHYLRKSNTQGTGLGLYISKSIVNLHGGKIWAESDGAGKGSVFSFSLPVFEEKNEKGNA